MEVHYTVNNNKDGDMEYWQGGLLCPPRLVVSLIYSLAAGDKNAGRMVDRLCLHNYTHDYPETPALSLLFLISYCSLVVVNGEVCHCHIKDWTWNKWLDDSLVEKKVARLARGVHYVDISIQKYHNNNNNNQSICQPCSALACPSPVELILKRLYCIEKGLQMEPSNPCHVMSCPGHTIFCQFKLRHNIPCPANLNPNSIPKSSKTTTLSTLSYTRHIHVWKVEKRLQTVQSL